MPDLAETIIVLRKTKLGETDLIITGLSEQGVQVRGVARGGRKPGSKLGAHLELYSVARVLLHKGRTLDIITEASGVVGNEGCRRDVLHSAGAAAIVELLDKISADGVMEPRLFPLACEALRSVGAVCDEGVALITAAALLKLSAQTGFKPSLVYCVGCGNPLPGDRENRYFSFLQGGVVCEDCIHELVEERYTSTDARLVAWADSLINSRFVDIESFADAQSEGLGQGMLGFAREWLRHHLVNRLKSLDFLIAFR